MEDIRFAARWKTIYAALAEKTKEENARLGREAGKFGDLMDVLRNMGLAVMIAGGSLTGDPQIASTPSPAEIYRHETAIGLEAPEEVRGSDPDVSTEEKMVDATTLEAILDAQSGRGISIINIGSGNHGHDVVVNATWGGGLLQVSIDAQRDTTTGKLYLKDDYRHNPQWTLWVDNFMEFVGMEALSEINLTKDTIDVAAEQTLQAAENNRTDAGVAMAEERGVTDEIQ